MSDTSTLAELLDSNPMARRVAVRFREEPEVTVADASEVLGTSYGDTMKAFRTIEKAGGGKFLSGRRGKETRIRWTGTFHEVIDLDEFQAGPPEGIALEQASIRNLIDALKVYHGVSQVSLTY